MQENEEKNIKIVAGSKKSRTFATAIEKQRLQRKKVPWMSGLVSGLQNRVRRFESARNLQKQERIRMKISNPFVFQLFTSSVVEGLEEEFSAQFENLGELVKNLIFPVGVDTFPTELSGRLRHVFSPAGAGPETLTGYLCLGIGTGNRTGRSEGLP